MRRNGAIEMPYLKVVDLRVHSYLDRLFLPECRKYLEALNLLPSSKVALWIYENAHVSCPWLLEFQSSRTWSSFVCDGPVKSLVKADVVDVPACAFDSCVSVLSALHLTDIFTPPNLTNPDTVVRAFGTPIKKIVLNGLLTDRAIELLTAPNEHVEELELVFVGCCTLVNMQRIQRVCPNLRRFVLRNSNILAEDMMRIDWSLWPKLQVLDLQNNYTLSKLPNLPATLTDLNVMNTGIAWPSEIGSVPNLRRFRVSVDSNRWASFFRLRTFDYVGIDVTSWGIDIAAFELYDCPRIDISFANKLTAKERTRALRKLWPNSFIKYGMTC